MTQEHFRKQDVEQFAKLGKSAREVQLELEAMRAGVPSIQLNRPCKLGDGVVGFPEDPDSLVDCFDEAAAAGRVMKFVPASGAASRMFRLLTYIHKNPPWSVEEIELRARTGDADCLELTRFLSGLAQFPFSGQLKKLMAGPLQSPEDLKQAFQLLLGPSGLDFARLPKGLVSFHGYPAGPRTALEEHLLEAVCYARDQQGCVRVHFTVPEQHRARIGSHLEDAVRAYDRPGTSFEVSLSVQEPSTDTVACDSEFRPVRGEDGRVLFRPGGHGALLENLNSLQADIVFLRNIDNVTHQRLHQPHSRIRKVLGGYLVRLQSEVFSALEQIVGGQIDEGQLDPLEDRVASLLSMRLEKSGSREERISTLYRCLDRPIRVCGVVRNEEDPGGGPFWVEEADGEISRQIVESPQVDLSSPEQLRILESSDFFNPVEIVCGLRSFDGRQFELSEYRDPSAGFVAEKSWNGRPIKVLELPGLWNGSMAYWNTVFFEIPREIFNPVKTVLDLLEPAHQAEE